MRYNTCAALTILDLFVPKNKVDEIFIKAPSDVIVLLQFVLLGSSHGLG
jgi:hypothetical protein